jgi:hypothetical protein
MAPIPPDAPIAPSSLSIGSDRVTRATGAGDRRKQRARRRRAPVHARGGPHPSRDGRENKHRFFPIPSAALATNPELDQSTPWMGS